MHTSVTDKADRTVGLALQNAIVIVDWKPVRSVPVTKLIGSLAVLLTFVIMEV
jgi:hypothetical protein